MADGTKRSICNTSAVRAAVREPWALSNCAMRRAPWASSSGSRPSSVDVAADCAAGWRKSAGADR